MTDDLADQAAVEEMKRIAEKAGRVIMKVFEQGFDISRKADKSPVTTADTASQDVIVPALREAFPDIPIISEEDEAAGVEVRSAWQRFFLVDPLDGTKQFIKRLPEFTVNIALMEHNRPVLGVLHLPPTRTTWFGGPGVGAFKAVGDDAPQAIACVKPTEDETVIVLKSHSALSERINRFLEPYPNKRFLEYGSALKFGLLAEGSAHLFPRFGQTWEWDTAAGHAILDAAGGSLTTPDGSLFPYNKDSLLNGPFVAKA